jgi:hypothetical protein
MPPEYRPDLVEVVARLVKRVSALERGIAVVDFIGAGGSTLNFNMTATRIDKCTSNVATPQWATRAIILVVGTVSALNNSGAAGFLLGTASINGSYGADTVTSVANGVYGQAVATAQRQIDNPPDNISITMAARNSSGTWSADPANISNVDAIGIFLR